MLLRRERNHSRHGQPPGDAGYLLIPAVPRARSAPTTSPRCCGRRTRTRARPAAATRARPPPISRSLPRAPSRPREPRASGLAFHLLRDLALARVALGRPVVDALHRFLHVEGLERGRLAAVAHHAALRRGIGE